MTRMPKELFISMLNASHLHRFVNALKSQKIKSMICTVFAQIGGVWKLQKNRRVLSWNRDFTVSTHQLKEGKEAIFLVASSMCRDHTRKIHKNS